MSSYRLGILIVLITLGLAGATCLAWVDASPRATRNLGSSIPPLGEFRFTERSGKEITQEDLRGRVWIAAFIFTRCKSSCPRITAAMSKLQEKLEGCSVQLVSISVDPEYDTPEVLTDFAKRYRADPERWWFLTGDRDATYDLIRSGFLQAVSETTKQEQEDLGVEAFNHSSRLALLNTGNQIISLVDTNEVLDDPMKYEAELDAFASRARSLAKAAEAPAWAKKLPALNASLNGGSALLLILGLLLIRSGKQKAHTITMVTCLVLSALFLTSYLTYHAQVGSIPFSGEGRPRVVYFTILLSHTVLAVLMLPLILLTVSRAVRKRFELHKKVSTIVYPIWLYVSITGVVIYWMLYRIDWTLMASA